MSGRKKYDLSIVILSYNTKSILRDCLTSLKESIRGINAEVWVVDNASSDGSPEMIKSEFPWVNLIVSDRNLGFAKGNNLVRDKVRGDYILFLNSDVIVNYYAIYYSLQYLIKNEDIGALTCKIVLPDGSLDKDTRRSFITPSIGLIHLLLRLDRVFPESRFFGRYWYGYIPEDVTHDVDVIQGAFFLTRKSVLDEVGWFDEDYFLDGEDIDLCWKIKKRGWRIVYYPKYSVVHLKGVSKGKSKNSKVSLRSKIYFRTRGVESMEIFYRKRLWNSYPFFINYLVILGIRFIKLVRVIGTLLFG